MAQNNEPKYPVGGFAPDYYFGKCSTCGEHYQGDKRAFQCRPCGEKSQAEWDAMTPEQQEERLKKNAEAWNEFINQQP